MRATVRGALERHRRGNSKQFAVERVCETAGCVRVCCVCLLKLLCWWWEWCCCQNAFCGF